MFDPVTMRHLRTLDLDDDVLASLVGHEDRAAALSLPAVEELLGFAREVERHRAETQAAEAELAWLAPGPPDLIIQAHVPAH